MLRKLLKYDIASIGRYWWILAVTAFGVSGIGGLAIRYLLYTDRVTEMGGVSDGVFDFFAVLALIICVLTLIVSLVVTPILIYVRFYKHFFTDEGYLTFTLPVSRRCLLGSKMLSAMFWIGMQMLLYICCIGMMLVIGIGRGLLSNEVWAMIFGTVAGVWKSIGVLWGIIYIVEIVLLLACSVYFSISAVYFCITIGAVVAKKAKVLLAVGIYYAFNLVMNILSQFLFVVCLPILAEGFSQLLASVTVNQGLLALALLLAVVLAMMAVVSTAIYFITLGLLERKLNLA